MSKSITDDSYRPDDSCREKVKEISLKLLHHVVPKCNDMGWCISTHGSLERDLDIVAVPWIKDAVSSNELVGVLKRELGVCVSGSCSHTPPEERDHGRVTYCFYMNSDELVECKAGAFPYVDVSIVDLRQFL